MALLAIDIGGTFVKHGVWNEGSLTKTARFRTPDTWELMKKSLLSVKEKMAEQFDIEGVAFSVPGAANPQTRQIEGESLIDYLHYFPIYDELEAAFGLPVSFENDARCAALAEIWKGSAKDSKDILFVVIGTGIGGAIVVDQKIVRGANMYAGEIGFMLLDKEQDFGRLATAVAMAKRYADRKGLPPNEIDGEEVFELAEKGDIVAQEEVDRFFYYLTVGLYNLASILNPEKIVIGGGVSRLEGFKQRIEKELEALFSRIYHNPYPPIIEIAAFKSDANLIGAVYHFKQMRSQQMKNIR